MSESRVALTVGLAKVLQKLGIDDQFRAEFQKDPHGALKRHGVEVSGKIGKVALPSKEELQKGFSELLDGALTDTTTQMAFGSKPPGPHPKPKP